MAWLLGLVGRFLKWLLPLVLPFVYEKIAASVQGYLARKRAEREVIAKNEAAAAQLEAAQTPQERNEAATTVINNL